MKHFSMIRILPKKRKETDDFWTGKNEKPVEDHSKASNSDDFWSGAEETKTETKKTDTDFWGGKGDAPEEELFNEKTMVKDANQFIGEIESKTVYIKIACRDHGDEDGDRVELRNNNKVVKSDLLLKNRTQYITLKLDFGMNRIDLKY